jgi:hypothetical protein
MWTPAIYGASEKLKRDDDADERAEPRRGPNSTDET